MCILTNSLKSIRYVAQPSPSLTDDIEETHDRFLAIPNTSLALTQAHVVIVGCGGLGGETAHGLIRMGAHRLTLLDADTVDITNLPRQFFYASDVGQAKAICLGRNLKAHATNHSTLHAHASRFQDAVAAGVDVNGDVAFCGVDNNQARVAVARHYYPLGIPCVFVGLSATGLAGYVFVQAPPGPCFTCVFPDALHDTRQIACAGSSAEIVKLAAGVALFAITSCLMPGRRIWDLKEFSLDAGPSRQLQIARRPDCQICGGR